MASCTLIRALIAGAIVGIHFSTGASVASNRAIVHDVSAPATVCLVPSAAQVAALRDDRLRVAVVVFAFEVPQPASGSLFAALLSGEPAKAHEMEQFGVHPLRSFSANQPGRRQRFLLSLMGHAHRLTPGRPVCLQVGFVATGASLTGGRAEVGLEWVPTPP